MTADPTREELIEALSDYPYLSEADELDQEGAMYWLANDYHSGGGSNLYSVLSVSEFRPGPLTNGPEDGMEQELYDYLEDRFFADVRDQNKAME